MKKRSTHSPSSRIKIREQRTFSEDAHRLYNQEPRPEFFSEFTEAIRLLPSPPIPEEGKQALLIWQTEPPPHPDGVEDLAKELTAELVNGAYKDSTHPAIQRFRSLYLEGEKLGWEQRLGIAGLAHNMNVLHRLYERGQKKDARNAIAVATYMYDLQAGTSIQDPADFPEDWIRQALGQIARGALPKDTSGRHWTTSDEKRKAQTRARGKISRSKDDKAEEKLRQDVLAAREEVTKNRTLHGQERLTAMTEAENQVLDEALASKNPHRHAAAVKIKKQRARQLRHPSA